MATIDILLASDIHPQSLTVYIEPPIKRAFADANVHRPDRVFYCDMYQRPTGQLYFRVSFYVGAPPTGELRADGFAVAAELTKLTNRTWTAYVATRRKRATNSVKVFGEYDINVS